MCELFAGGSRTNATSVLLRRRFQLTVRGYFLTHRFWGLGGSRAVSNFHAYP